MSMSNARAIAEGARARWVTRKIPGVSFQAGQPLSGIGLAKFFALGLLLKAKDRTVDLANRHIPQLITVELAPLGAVGANGHGQLVITRPQVLMSVAADPAAGATPPSTAAAAPAPTVAAAPAPVAPKQPRQPLDEQKISDQLTKIPNGNISRGGKIWLTLAYVIPVALPFIPVVSIIGLALPTLLPLAVLTSPLAPLALAMNLIPGLALTLIAKITAKSSQALAKRALLKGADQTTRNGIAQIAIQTQQDKSPNLSFLTKEIKRVRATYAEIDRLCQRQGVDLNNLAAVEHQISRLTSCVESLPVNNTEVKKAEQEIGYLRGVSTALTAAHLRGVVAANLAAAGGPDPAAPAAPAAPVASVAPAAGVQTFTAESGTVYTVVERIGKGGMAVVYKVRDPEGNPFALKLLLKPEPAPPNATHSQQRAISDAADNNRRRFNREIGLLRDLQNSSLHIINFHEEGSVVETGPDGPIRLPFVIMECVDGSLRDEMGRRGGTIDASTAADVVVQVARGLQTALATRPAHSDNPEEQGIVHRDINPKNILIKRAPGTGSVITAKIADFGLGKSLSGEGEVFTTTNDLGGTDGYISPELLVRGWKRAETEGIIHLGDIFALGMTLYAMVTGNPHSPFLVRLMDGNGGTARERAKRLSEEIRALTLPLVCTGGAFEAAFRKMVDPDHTKRFQSYQEVIDAFSALAPASVQRGATPSSLPEQSGPVAPARRDSEPPPLPDGESSLSELSASAILQVNRPVFDPIAIETSEILATLSPARVAEIKELLPKLVNPATEEFDIKPEEVDDILIWTSMLMAHPELAAEARLVNDYALALAEQDGQNI